MALSLRKAAPGFAREGCWDYSSAEGRWGEMSLAHAPARVALARPRVSSAHACARRVARFAIVVPPKDFWPGAKGPPARAWRPTGRTLPPTSNGMLVDILTSSSDDRLVGRLVKTS